MPLDSGGKFRHNSQVAKMHSKPQMSKPAMENEEDTGEAMTEVHGHGDGSYHTVHKGKHEEHPDFHHMTSHLAAMHGEPEEEGDEMDSSPVDHDMSESTLGGY